MSDVEFVNGHAAYQNEAFDAGESGNENREAAKKAVEAAIKAEGKKEKAPAKEAEATEPKKAQAKVSSPKPRVDKSVDDVEASDTDGETEDEPDSKPKKSSHAEDDDDAEGLRKVLKNRARIAKEKASAAQENQRQQADFNRRKAELDHYAQQLQEQAKHFERLRTNPVEAVRQAGYDPEEFILNLAESGTPEGRQKAQLAAMQAQIDQSKQWQEAQLHAQRQHYERAQYQQAVDYRGSIEKQFLGAAMDEAKAPHTVSFYKGREAALISEGDIIAAQYRELTGKEASVSDIAEYIEEQLAERAKAWYDSHRKAQEQALEQEDPEGSAVVEVQSSGAKRKVTKTLSPETSGSERRALTKDLKNLDDEELKEVAKQNVRLALSKHRAPKE